MPDRHVIARLSIEPCGLFERVKHTISLVSLDSNYRLEVLERDYLERKKKRRFFALNKTEVDEQLAILRDATVPAFPVSESVCDGWYSELMVTGENSTITLGWWVLTPKGAEKFVDFACWLEKAAGLGDDEELQALVTIQI